MLPLVLIAMAIPVFGQSASTASAVSASSAVVPSDAPTPVFPPVMAPGSACPEGDNGEWNCLSTCWQRCAAGFWSNTMALAPGTQCIPLGLSFDLQIVHASVPALTSTYLSAYSSSINSTVATLSEATCVCSTTSCTVLSSASPSPSSPPSPSPSSTTNDAGFKSGASSGGSSFGSDIAVVLSLGLLK
ncbi:extracellular protein [Ophiostoma piceae UAMH 11346]|uniref:Extracellular protein n=1 Tax=Ophiostoma piceae (strain UAMH 11346) TaxID=1262450 RepID=S3BTP5_OPHP1|nr:extracellular protein [Ophiostoma piceae UAMH 11346]